MNIENEIDWDEVVEIYKNGISRLLCHTTPAAQITLVFWSDANGGFNFDIYQKLSESSQVRLGDCEDDWGTNFDHLDEVFEELSEQFAEEDDFESLDRLIREKLRSVVEKTDLIASCPDGVETVVWTIQDESS